LNTSGTPTGTTSYHYEYNLSDNLGNVRVSFDKNASTGLVEEIQEDQYYAFGLRSPLFVLSTPQNRYLYNKKEVQTDLANQYDYGHRFYDPVVAHWNSIDPLAEDDRKWSPNVYGEDNPIRFEDPDGMETEDANDDPPGSHGSIIQPTNPAYRLMHPDLAAIHDVAYNILDAVGIVDLVNNIGDLGDKNISTKDKVGHLVQSTVNVLSIGEEGEGEGIHKNSNDYVGHQGVYEIKVDGEVHKYGKADMTNTSKTTGQPTRLQSQVNKIRKENPSARVEGEVLHQNKKISTKDAKEIETQKIQQYKNKNNKLPPGNQNHPGTN
jgi:RHS repeat-associated protein